MSAGDRDRLAIVELAEQQRQCIYARALVGIEMDDEPLWEVPVRPERWRNGVVVAGCQSRLSGNTRQPP